MATLAATVLLADQARTQPTCTITFTPASGIWNLPGNWDAGRVPGATDNVCIPAGRSVEYDTGTTQILSVQGAGTLEITFGTLEVTQAASDAQLATLLLEGGALGGAGDVILTGPNSVWSGGVMDGAGSTEVSAGATLAQRTNSVSLANGRQLNNAGLIELETNNTTIGIGAGAAGRINNLAGGTIRRVAAPGAGTSFINVQLDNDGLVEALSGTLDISGTLINYNSGTEVLTGGTFAARGAALNLPGPVETNAAHLIIEGVGQMSDLNGLSTNAAAGIIDADSVADLTVNGPLTNAGTVRVGDGSEVESTGDYTQTGGGLTQLLTSDALVAAVGGEVDIQGGRLEGIGIVESPLRNAAEVRPGNSPGILTVEGSYTQTAAGTLRTEIGGATPGTQYDRLVINGTAVLGGTLAGDTINGFAPAEGSSFQVVTCNPCTGTFGSVTSTGLPSGLVYAPSQTGAATSLVVVASGPPPDTTPPDTTVTSGPSGPTDDDTPTFAFNANEAGSTFECSVDGGPFAPCSSPFTTPSLSAGQHTFSVRARDAAGNVGPASTSQFQVAPKQIEDLPPLTNNDVGEVAQVGPASGTVLIAVRTAAASAKAGASQKGLRFVPLEEAREIPIGSFLDTTRGTVEMVSATGQGNRTQSGKFSAGLFQVLQSRRRRDRGLTELSLKGGNFRRCGSSARGGRTASAALSRRTIRRLRSSATGRFRTRGRNSSATVRGTIWTTTDRCDGTLTQVRRGTVIVRDFRRKRNVAVRAGKSYLARARG